MSLYFYILIAIVILIAVYLIYTYYFKKQQPLIKNVGTNDSTDDSTNDIIHEEFKEPDKKFNINSGDPYFVIAIDGEEIGKLKFELFDEDVPKTCANFRYLCAKGLDKKNEPCY